MYMEHCHCCAGPYHACPGAQQCAEVLCMVRAFSYTACQEAVLAYLLFCAARQQVRCLCPPAHPCDITKCPLVSRLLRWSIEPSKYNTLQATSKHWTYCIFQAPAILVTSMHCLPHTHSAVVQVRNKQPSLAHTRVLRRRRPHVTASAGHALARKLHT